jgi:ABC-type molybdate transport system substrate-binding protein
MIQTSLAKRIALIAAGGLALCSLGATVGSAAEIKVLTSVALTSVLNELAPNFEHATGNKLNESPELVAKGEAEIGVGQASEIVPIAGAEVLGPLPGEFASTTVWTAGIGTTTKVPDMANSFIQFLIGPVARPVLSAKGFQPG